MKEKLINICNPKQWKTLSTSELIENGLYDVYGANGIIGKYNAYNHEESVVTITCRGATCGNVHITSPKAYVNGNAMCLDNLNENICLKKYLSYYLQNYNMKKVISGSAQPQITVRGLSKIEIKLYGINTQKVIINRLEKLEGLIGIRKKQIKYLDNLIKSQFVEMFGNIFEYEKLENYSVLITKGASPKWQGVNYQNDGTLFVTSENVRDGFVDISKPKYLDNKINEILPRSVLKRDDILINIVGASIGRAAKYNYDYLANINQAVALVRTKNINNIFLLTYLNSDEAIRIYDDMKKGGARENLSLKNIADLKIPKAPIEEQNKFAEFVKLVDKQKVKIQKSLEEMQQLQKSLMSNYF